MSVSAVHGAHELERMFGEFGLGTEHQREQFRRLAHSYEYTPPAEESMAFGLGDSTAKASEGEERACDAKLA